MTRWFDVEQEILKCWDIKEDLKLITEKIEHDDELCNKILGVMHVYDMRFNKLWEHFEEGLEEFYDLKQKLKAKNDDPVTNSD